MSRQALAGSHRAIGLTLGLLFVLQAASGAALVFREGLLVALNSQLLTAPPPEVSTALDRILAKVDLRFDRPAVERLVYPQGERTAALVYLRAEGIAGRRVIASDPATGAILGEIEGMGLVPFVLFRLHDELLIGNTGHALLFGEGIALLYLVIVGTFLGRRRVQGPVRMRWKGSRRIRWFDLHRCVGLSFGALILFTATTGAILQADFLASATGSPPLRRDPTDWTLLMPHLARLQHRYGAGAITEVRISEDRGAATILVHAREGMRPLALDRVQIDLGTGAATPVRRAVDEPMGRWLLGWIYPLHSGKALGGLGAAVALATAFALLIMPVLGFLMWRAKPARKRQRANRRN